MASYVGSMPNGDSIYLLEDGRYAYGSDAAGWQYTTSDPRRAGAPVTGPRSNNPPPVNPGYTYTYPREGYVSTDRAGSYDEWFEVTVAAMANNYMMGIGQTSGFQDPSLGAPNEADFGSGKDGRTGTISLQTRRFFENYVRLYGATDPWITERFGPPPDRRATYNIDPNSPAGQQAFAAGENAKQREWQSGENAADRQTDLAIAQGGWENAYRIAVMQDATDRYIAEGNWGVQKYVAELQERGALERLQLELGFRRQELGQRAVEERQRHHEAMVGLTLEVAKYDAELAAQPRNWLKYAAWLESRGEVIDGLNLATAATVLPEDQINPAVVSGVPGGALAAAQEIANGGGQYSVAGIDLNSTDYSGMANQLLGVNMLGQSSAPSLDELNAVSGTLQTSQTSAPSQQTATSVPQPSGAFASLDQVSSGQRPGFQAYSGPTVNRLGMNIQPSGHKEIASRFRRLLPSQQEMRIGEVESIGRYSPDFLAEMERSRPKGRAQGAAAYG